MLKTKLALYFILLYLPIGCVKEEKQIIPDVSVDFSINLNLPNYNVLSNPNVAIKYPGVGYNRNGVIVYRYSLDEFYAFDATCPQHIDVSTSINLDQNGTSGTATCPHCNTIYYLVSGGTSKGYPLKKYRTSFDVNSKIVYVFN